MAASQLDLHVCICRSLTVHIYGLGVAVGVAEGPGFVVAGVVGGVVVVRGRAGGVLTGAGGSVRAGAVRWTGASGVSFDGNCPAF